MLTVKVEEELKDVLIKIAEIENRSQGNMIEQWIKNEAKRLKIPIEKSQK